MECRSAFSFSPLAACLNRATSAGRAQGDVEDTRLIDEVRDAFVAYHRTVEQDANGTQFLI
jgi:hypothetical protein